MELIKPIIEVEKYDGIRIMKRIERACRTCYRSENKISEDSYKNLIKNCINRGHESVLEHEKITVRLTCDIGVYKDLTRHRAGTAFSIESTRYCAYGKEKFDRNLKIIEPCNIEKDSKEYVEWYNCMQYIENTYLSMTELGCIPDQLRMILPHSTAAQVTMTCNIREWRHIFNMRANNHAHPAIQQLLIPLLLKFKEDMPELFENVEYNKEFPIDKYAELKFIEDID